MKSPRRGASLVEFLVVLAIISVLIGLLMPAIQAARTRARDAVCQNHVRQLSLATAHFFDVEKRIPAPSQPGKIGGWAIEILPFMEQGNLTDSVTSGTPIASAPPVLYRQPTIMRCPAQDFRDEKDGEGMRSSHYVLNPHNNRKSYWISDSPIDVALPWVNSPEAPFSSANRGPHHRGFHVSYGFENGTSWVEGQ